VLHPFWMIYDICFVYNLKTENKILNNWEGMVFPVWLNINITQ